MMRTVRTAVGGSYIQERRMQSAVHYVDGELTGINGTDSMMKGARMKKITVEFNSKRVANLLKHMVNNSCEEGFKWYKDVTDEMPTIYDINHAIMILENTETETLEVGE